MTGKNEDKWATVEAHTLGYPAPSDPMAIKTHIRKQQQRVAKGIPGGYGCITEEDAARIEAARMKRERKAKKSK